MSTRKIDNVIFDLGGVLVDWNPEYLYYNFFKQDREKMSWFLENVCTNDWNMEQDAGRSLNEATQILLDKFPEYHEAIRAFYGRWEEMLKGEIKGTKLILNELHSLNEKKLYALTNWSAETFPIAQKRFSFLNLFEGIVVSGEEHTRKPFDKIYQILLDRYDLIAEKSVFIDDNNDNIRAAQSMGFYAILFKSPEQLRSELIELNLLNP